MSIDFTIPNITLVIVAIFACNTSVGWIDLDISAVDIIPSYTFIGIGINTFTKN